jgi:hypothetical protein
MVLLLYEAGGLFGGEDVWVADFLLVVDPAFLGCVGWFYFRHISFRYSTHRYKVNLMSFLGGEELKCLVFGIMGFVEKPPTPNPQHQECSRRKAAPLGAFTGSQ